MGFKNALAKIFKGQSKKSGAKMSTENIDNMSPQDLIKKILDGMEEVLTLLSEGKIDSAKEMLESLKIYIDSLKIYKATIASDIEKSEENSLIDSIIPQFTLLEMQLEHTKNIGIGDITERIAEQTINQYKAINRIRKEYDNIFGASSSFS